VGRGVGKRVGSLEVGRSVGLGEGIKEGLGLGAGVGNEDGIALGEGVGITDGLGLGDRVGNDVGFSVGVSVSNISQVSMLRDISIKKSKYSEYPPFTYRDHP